ncbi:efflux RND transporter periplasmic adaptor subunit [Pseudogulbenkiania subflava]|uniref:RND family efflux transporter, MFP subunit n=1 Tax=Pseudogulbenkiania subflava DSM 22618 TaxID=1123014 RepID=A0A1Y6C900_9NEIS|nr:efflux RND transporter periplasmic adaptor subunit [Pseudogulbenkiania subflava]SMF40563.1 RND family efflux transporter, MFP subunit [Pseudogulbenkiania subflava DSM 22618]
MKTPHSRWLLTALAVLGLAACSKDAAVQEDIRPVRYVTASDNASLPGASFAGDIRARQETPLAFRVGGKIAQRLVNTGERVKKGQILARLDANDYQLDLTAKQAQLAAARSDLEQQQTDLKRSQELLGKQFISQAQVDRQQNAVNAARARLQQAQAQLAGSRNQNSYATLVADADGVIGSVSAEAGQVVSAGQPVLRLAMDGPREVAIQVPENALAALRAAKALQVKLWADGQTFNGTLRELAADADPATRTYAARISLDGANAGLALGMSASVTLPAPSQEHKLQLPLSALLDQDGRHYVWVIDPKSHKVGRREVSVQGIDASVARVSGALRAGEQVVSAGVHLLRDGQQVRLLQP